MHFIKQITSYIQTVVKYYKPIPIFLKLCTAAPKPSENIFKFISPSFSRQITNIQRHLKCFAFPKNELDAVWVFLQYIWVWMKRLSCVLGNQYVLVTHVTQISSLDCSTMGNSLIKIAGIL
ncbi:hypothetical protein CIPAW_16G094000 [Carya illinoinensis]|uniref:Uncharacterized protein n=1 Tax=Carya illinoinensis TaxID=32201 RepID=A0A8T1N9E9_CARIL|nr:hypothetical protein CIPAW_16G094000 [Carya illinoinensis]